MMKLLSTKRNQLSSHKKMDNEWSLKAKGTRYTYSTPVYKDASHGTMGKTDDTGTVYRGVEKLNIYGYWVVGAKFSSF